MFKKLRTSEDSIRNVKKMPAPGWSRQREFASVLFSALLQHPQYAIQIIRTKALAGQCSLPVGGIDRLFCNRIRPALRNRTVVTNSDTSRESRHVRTAIAEVCLPGRIGEHGDVLLQDDLVDACSAGRVFHSRAVIIDIEVEGKGIG